jgi:hypothetical protein
MDEVQSVTDSKCERPPSESYRIEIFWGSFKQVIGHNRLNLPSRGLSVF